MFLVYSLYQSEDDIEELEKPLFFKLRKGKIGIGTIVEGEHKLGKNYLSLEDLEKHMNNF